MLVGYCRVSTNDQNLDLQRDALRKAGCERVFSDTTSGISRERSGLSDALRALQRGDTLVVWKLDRLGRSLAHLIDVVSDLEARGVGFRSLTESLDTTTAGGRLVFHVFAALGEFERDLIRERTKAGLVAARQRGRIGGRPRLVTTDKLDAAKKLLASGTPIGDVARVIGVGRSTLYRWLPMPTGPA